MATALADADESILITPAELHVIFKSPIDHENRVVCIAAGRNAASASFESCHLPNSVFFNLDEIRDTTSRYPVMLPTCQVFTAAMKRLGIRATRGDTFIVYDTVEAGGHLLRSPSGLDIGTLWAQKRTGTQQLSAVRPGWLPTQLRTVSTLGKARRRHSHVPGRRRGENNRV